MATNKKEYYIKKKYGLSLEAYQAMLEKHGNKCWICGKPPKNLSLNIDHDHKTGQVRGLLDFFCNKFMIGRRRREHAYLFRKAADYLESTYDWRDYGKEGVPSHTKTQKTKS